jgi:type IV fimbrial biogenesis protein FimT
MSGSAQSGFSMIELMITVAVAAILMAIAAPNFRDSLARTRVSGAANELQAAASLARAEALKLKSPVTLCARATDTACAAGTSWNDGFLLFQDPNGNGLPDEGELILRTRPFSRSDVQISNTAASISMLGNGRLAGGGIRTFEILGPACTAGAGTGPDNGLRRQVSIAASGRASTRRVGCG